MIASPAELMLADLKSKYEAQASSPAFARLYEDDDEFGHAFSVLHKKLNDHFEAINGRAVTSRHYWAEDSRNFIALIAEIDEDLHVLKRSGIEVGMAVSYRDALDRCKPWLSRSNGSAVPEDFEPITLIKFEPAFARASDSVKLIKQQASPKLSMVGEGSYALVYSYIDPVYGIQFALKRAKRGITDRDLLRFKQEFDVMSRLSFPYVVQVYRYDDERNEYRMEFCDETLRTYISKRNSNLVFATRKRIALQFLYGMNYLHVRGLLHRDISLQNVLMKVFDHGAVLVKLSDFGLVKEATSDFTRTQSELRGTIRDPALDDFKRYGVANEIYAIGWVLWYIFTGKESLRFGADEVSGIIQRCVDHDPDQRYQKVSGVIAAVEALAVNPTDAPA